jgi:hypothetical protein
MIIKVVCFCCRSIVQLDVNEEGFNKWKNGELIQNALPELTQAQRELLISNMCETCWNRTFK